MQPSAFIDRRTEPDSPVSRTPSMGLDDQVNRSLPELKALGNAVYKEVWNEFYNWEPGYCDQILGTLPLLAAKTEVFKVAREMMVGFLEDTRDPGSGLETKYPRTADVVVASMTNYDANGRGSIKQMVMPVTTVDLGLVPPHPVYESCPPVSRSVRLGEHHHEDLAAFLPYADDTTFSAIEYLGGFESFDWETPFDPDLEMIQLETVRRLHVMHGIVLQDISRMGIFKPLCISHNTGLLWDQSQRDFLHWPGAFQVALEDDLPRSHAPHQDDLQSRLTSVLRTFCPSLNCLTPLCQTHGNLHTNTYLPSKKPQVTGESMCLSEGDPCGPGCFRLIQDFDRFMETLPPSPTKASNIASLEILATVLGIAPDLYPCQLAVLCLKPCQEVFTQRLHLFPDHTILPPTSHSTSVEPSTDADTQRETSLSFDNSQQRKKKKKNIRTKLEFVDEPSHFNCAPLAACAHPGLCATNQCPCWLAKQHCTLACRCGISCARQWPPCNCTNGRCVPETCSCQQGGRECVPGICLKCDAAGQTTGPCSNTRMQRLDSKPLEIKRGKHGLGAFARGDLNSGRFIGTYVGQILTTGSADHTTEITQHNSLNYLFEVTPDNDNVQLPVFDAAYIGNATRFLNHKAENGDNVEAHTLLVNGEHQIGFFTKKKVKAREELFLDYGMKYWKEPR